MEPHTRLLHQARIKSLWMPVVVIGILFTTLCLCFDIHCITPGRICTPFAKEISWEYTSSIWFDMCFFCIAIFTVSYFRVILTRYRADVLRIRNVACTLSSLFALGCIICGRTEYGQKLISHLLEGTLFADMLLPDYYGIVFAFFVGTCGGITIGIAFGIFGLFNVAIEGIIISTLMGAISGMVAFAELLIHKGVFPALLYGGVLLIANVSINALGIAALGAPLSVLQKLSSMSIDASERSDRLYRKRISRK